MERSELKEILKEKGLDEKLLSMPAIVEPIYLKALNNEMAVSKLQKDEDLVVTQEGSFLVDGRNISFGDDGIVLIEDTKKDGTMTINQYGMEELYREGDPLYAVFSIERKDGKIIEESINNGNCISVKSEYLDNGDWSLENAKGILLEKSISGYSEYEIKLEDLNEEEILADFDSVSTSMIENYPQTAEWYATTRENIRKQIQDKKAELAKIIQEERDPDRLIAENEQLKMKNEQLKMKNEKLAKMLEKSLDFVANVKKHPLGKIFFHKKIEEFDRDTNTLDSGEER